MRTARDTVSLDDHLGQDYPVTIFRAEEGGFVAEVEDLPGCISQGETLEEVYQSIDEARCLWIQTAYEDGMEIPIPRTDERYSGRFLTRIPKSLHRRLAEQAKREGVSLNQYIETILATHSMMPTENVENIYIDLMRRTLSGVTSKSSFLYSGTTAAQLIWKHTEAEEMLAPRLISQGREEVRAV